jgi:hypothetical protein
VQAVGAGAEGTLYRAGPQPQPACLPRWIPQTSRRAKVFPVDRKRAAEWIVLRCGAEPVADGIRPDVPGDVFGIVCLSQNVVVVARLPQGEASLFSMCKSRLLFEFGDKTGQVTGVALAFYQNVQVVRHQTIGVEREVMTRGTGYQLVQELTGGRLARKYAPAVQAAQGDEVGSPPTIVFGGETYRFAAFGHERTVSCGSTVRVGPGLGPGLFAFM